MPHPQRCVDPSGNEYGSILGEDEGPYICTKPPDDGMLTCPPATMGNFYYTPGTNYTLCKGLGVNPDSGVTSFDNFFTAFLTVFLVFSMEGWTEIMYYAQVPFGS